MQLKTYLAKDMKTALANVRAELGTDAVIIATERAKDGGVMVRIATERKTDDDVPEILQAEMGGAAWGAGPNAPALDFSARYHDGLIKRLREPAPTTTREQRRFDRAQLLGLLGRHRTPETIAHELAQAAEKSGLSDMTLALASALDKRMVAKPLALDEAAALLLIGPNGAGKSASAAKLAAHARLAGREVVLIAADASGAGAVARIDTFAEHLGAKAIVAEHSDDIVKALADARAEDALAIIDTAGFDPRNAKARTAFSALTKMNNVETIGIVSACGDAEEIGEIAQALGAGGANRIIVTGLDLTHRLGALAAAACFGPGLAYVTRSPFIAGVLETLTPLSLARTLIETGTGNADQGGAQ
jgi:flagellar biosynthesis protein FlhF